MSYLARLKAEISGKAATVTTVKTAISPFDSLGSSDGEHISENEVEEKAEAVDALPALESIAEDSAEFYEERAAIIELDGGQSRDDAEAAAREATERHRRECWNRFQKRADAILSLPLWEARLKAVERHRQAHGEIAGQEMMSWIRGKSGLDSVTLKTVPGLFASPISYIFKP